MVNVMSSERVSEHIVKQIEVIPMPQTIEEIQLVPQDRILERFVEENIDVLVIKLVPHERIPEHTVEETIDVPLSQVMEHMTKVAKFICQKRVLVELPVPQIQEQTVEVANAVPQKARNSVCHLT